MPWLNVSDYNAAIMIGDRNYDINAANEVGIDSIGVLWGFGDRKELEAAGATYIVHTPMEVADYEVKCL